MIDNLFTHPRHVKADTSNMPLSDFCLIKSRSHNPNQNDSGYVPQGTRETGEAALVSPDKSIIFPAVRIFF